MSSLRKKSINSFVWAFSEQIGTGVLGLTISIILQRILEPADFGLIGMIIVFNAIGLSLVMSGMGASLIRSKENTEIDYSTVFFYNIAISLFLYLIIFFSAGFIADFYDQPILKNLTRIYALSIVIRSFVIVQEAYLTKEFAFKKMSIAQIIAIFIAGIVGVNLALSGYGVWSLAIYPIIQNFIVAISFWIISSWKPKFTFSKESFDNHFNFGYKVTLAGLIDTVFKNLYNIILGRFFNPAIVGYYNRAETLSAYPPNILSIALRKVTLPMFAEIQDDNHRLKIMYQKILKIALFILSPIMICGILVAEPLFLLVFTEKWLPAVPYFQILCLVGLMLPLQTYNMNILHVKGRSEVYLRISIYKRISFLIGLPIAFQLGIYGLLIWLVISSVISFFINSYFCGRMISYSVLEQIRDALYILIPAFIIGLLSYVLFQYLLANIIFNQILQIVLLVFIYCVSYVALHFFIKSSSYNLLLQLTRDKIK